MFPTPLHVACQSQTQHHFHQPRMGCNSQMWMLARLHCSAFKVFALASPASLGFLHLTSTRAGNLERNQESMKLCRKNLFLRCFQLRSSEVEAESPGAALGDTFCLHVRAGTASDRGDAPAPSCAAGANPPPPCAPCLWCGCDLWPVRDYLMPPLCWPVPHVWSGGWLSSPGPVQSSLLYCLQNDEDVLPPGGLEPWRSRR